MNFIEYNTVNLGRIIAATQNDHAQQVFFIKKLIEICNAPLPLVKCLFYSTNNPLAVKLLVDSLLKLSFIRQDDLFIAVQVLEDYPDQQIILAIEIAKLAILNNTYSTYIKLESSLQNEVLEILGIGSNNPQDPRLPDNLKRDQNGQDNYLQAMKALEQNVLIQ